MKILSFALRIGSLDQILPSSDGTSPNKAISQYFLKESHQPSAKRKLNNRFRQREREREKEREMIKRSQTSRPEKGRGLIQVKKIGSCPFFGFAVVLPHIFSNNRTSPEKPV
jgi:hypothetical protein